jgi:hypothetical protein
VVPEVFGKSSDIDNIELKGMGDFVDLKGNHSSDLAFRARFSRSNSSSIQWNNISYSNIPRIADDYWAHPGFSRDD